MTAWALALAGSSSQHWRGTVCMLAERALESPMHGEAGYTAIVQAILTARLLTADESHAFAARVNALLERVHARASPSIGVVSSRAHLELSAALRAAGWQHECEVPLEGGLLVLDMACTSSRVAVEFDGPSHYLHHVATGEEIYDGSTLWKTRVLEASGWCVHRVGWRQWAAVQGALNREHRDAFVKDLVEALHTPH